MVFGDVIMYAVKHLNRGHIDCCVLCREVVLIVHSYYTYFPLWLPPKHMYYSYMYLMYNLVHIVIVLRYCYEYHYVVCVQVLIPVRGSKATGQVRSIATVRNGKWQLDTVVLEFKGRPEKLIIVESDD